MSSKSKEVRDHTSAAENFQKKRDDDPKLKPKEMEGAVGLIYEKISSFQDRKKKQKVTPILSRVPDSIRAKHEMEYEPQIIAIGPYHRNNGRQVEEINPRLKPMEDIKLQFLMDLCKREAENKSITMKEFLKTIATAVQMQESIARNIYAESSFVMSSEDFVEMLVLDGCFIVELMFKAKNGKNNNNITKERTFQGKEYELVLRDLILFENQIPYFILQTIFAKCFNPSSEFNLLDLAFNLLFKPRNKNIQPKKLLPADYLNEGNPEKIHHLLHLSHIVFVNELNLSSCQENHSTDETKSIGYFAKFLNSIKKFSDKHILGCTLSIWECFYNTQENTTPEFQAHTIPTATQLHTYGVQFQRKMIKDSDHYYNISFKDGVLEIPHTQIDNGILTELCNFMVLEQSCPEYKKKITCYALFMDHLIDTADDVALLNKEMVIENDIGSMKKVASLFNNICNGLVIDTSNDAYFNSMYQEINMYCKKPINEWRAMLKRDYFGSPWSLIALYAAGFMIFLTIVQTLCSIGQTVFSLQEALDRKWK